MSAIAFYFPRFYSAVFISFTFCVQYFPTNSKPLCSLDLNAFKMKFHTIIETTQKRTNLSSYPANRSSSKNLNKLETFMMTHLLLFSHSLSLGFCFFDHWASQCSANCPRVWAALCKCQPFYLSPKYRRFSYMATSLAHSMSNQQQLAA